MEKVKCIYANRPFKKSRATLGLILIATNKKRVFPSHFLEK